MLMRIIEMIGSYRQQRNMHVMYVQSYIMRKQLETGNREKIFRSENEFPYYTMHIVMYMQYCTYIRIEQI